MYQPCPRSHTSVSIPKCSSHQCRTLIAWCANLNTASLVPNCAHTALHFFFHSSVWTDFSHSETFSTEVETHRWFRRTKSHVPKMPFNHSLWLCLLDLLRGRRFVAQCQNRQKTLQLPKNSNLKPQRCSCTAGSAPSLHTSCVSFLARFGTNLSAVSWLNSVL